MRLKVSCLCWYFLHCITSVRSYRVCNSLTFAVYFLLRSFLSGFHSKENKNSAYPTCNQWIYLHCFFLQGILKVYLKHSIQLVTNCVELVAHDRFTCPSLVAITFRTSQSAHTSCLPPPLLPHVGRPLSLEPAHSERVYHFAFTAQQQQQQQIKLVWPDERTLNGKLKTTAQFSISFSIFTK